MKRPGSNPLARRGRPGRFDAGGLCGAAGTIGGVEVVVLGRAGDGGWLLLPRSAFGTADARDALLKSSSPPALGVSASNRAARPAGRDRRGAWMRRS